MKDLNCGKKVWKIVANQSEDWNIEKKRWYSINRKIDRFYRCKIRKQIFCVIKSNDKATTVLIGIAQGKTVFVSRMPLISNDLFLLNLKDFSSHWKFDLWWPVVCEDIFLEQ